MVAQILYFGIVPIILCVKYFSGKRRPSDPIGGADNVPDTPQDNSRNGASENEQIGTSRCISPTHAGEIIQSRALAIYYIPIIF